MHKLVFFIFIWLIQGNQTRDLTFNLYLKKQSALIFQKNINVSIESCSTSFNHSKEKRRAQFQLNLNHFHEILNEFENQHWLPVFLDNSNWNGIEFICKIELTLLSVSDNSYSFKDFQFVSAFHTPLVHHHKPTKF